MKTTIVDNFPWLKDRLTDWEITELDDYVYESMDEAVDDVRWEDVEDKFRWEFDNYADQVADEFMGRIKESLKEIDPWHYHNDHGHAGRIDMCYDEVCQMLEAYEAAVQNAKW